MSLGGRVQPWIVDKMDDEGSGGERGGGVGVDGGGGDGSDCGGSGSSKQMFLIDYRDSGT